MMGTNPMKKMLDDAQALDKRRQLQIQNQVQAINRLLKNGEYDSEMESLHALLASTQLYVDQLHELLRANKIDVPAPAHPIGSANT